MKQIHLFAVLGLLFLAFVPASCKKANLKIEVPKAIERKINKIEREKEPKSIVEVWQWKTNL